MVPQPEPDPRDVLKPVDVGATLAPAHTVSFPGSSNIYSVAFSPDGATAYCMIDRQSIDLWAAGVRYWPGALGGVLGLVLLVYALIVVRRWRRPQERGRPHCRRCNYNVMAQAPDSVGPRATRRDAVKGTLCPECGVDLSVVRPRRGRALARRVAVPTTVVVLLCAGYAYLYWSGGSPLSAARAGEWWSAWVDEYAEKHKVEWLLAYRKPVFSVQTVDTRTGEIKGTLCTSASYPVGGMTMAPDGRHLAIGDRTGTVRWVSTSSGWTSASVMVGSFQRGGRDGACVVGFDGPDSDPWAYVGAVEGPRAVSRLLKWRPRTGELQTVVEESAYVAKRGGKLVPSVRRYALLRWPEGIATASAPDFTQGYDEKSYSVTVRVPASQGGAELRIIRMASEHVIMSPLAVTPDGERLYMSGMSDGIVGVNLRTGEDLGALKAGPMETMWDRFTISRDGARLFIAVQNASILVRNVTQQAWEARLTFPSEYLAPSLYASADGRWLAATPFKQIGSGPPGGSYQHDLFLYDLSALGAPAKPASK